MRKVLFIIIAVMLSAPFGKGADRVKGIVTEEVTVAVDVESAAADAGRLLQVRRQPLTIYDMPYSRTLSLPQWKKLWVNTSVLVGAGITTMIVLEALPENATAWNKHTNSTVPLFSRWWRNVRRGPVWDGDNIMFNYVLHPYAGAAYYMGGRSCGLNCLGAFVYCFCISNFFWEYGFESFNEIPSVQDLIITPFVGSLLGEGFYLVKRHIVSHDYRLFGSKVAGYAVAFLVDPLNEFLGYFRGDQRRHHLKPQHDNGSGFSTTSWISPSKHGITGGLAVKYVF